jgi:hypothetical protein
MSINKTFNFKSIHWQIPSKRIFALGYALLSIYLNNKRRDKMQQPPPACSLTQGWVRA